MRLHALSALARVERYHATALSNFIRGWDKYGRVYSKRGIPESTYPDRFFLLPRAELHIGLAKASRLVARTALPGDRVLVLETRVEPRALQPNLRTGLGEWVARDFLEVEALFLVEPDGALRPITVEDAAAESLACHLSAARGWHELRPRTISILPVARGCQAACDFCFSKASVSRDVRAARLPWPRIEAVVRAARRRGAERAVITGGGEPGLLPDGELAQLVEACARELPKVVLITNGHSLARREAPARRAALARLAAAGLGVLSLSRHHHERERNARILHLDTDTEAVIESWRAHRAALDRLTLRLVCVLQRGGIEDAAGLDAYLAWAASLGVGEVCFKELYVSTSRESEYHSERANAFSREHQVPLKLVLDRAAARGWRRAGELPWGAPLFDAEIDGRPMKVAAYTEPSVSWELSHGLCRSWNLMADGRCLASLEDRASEVEPA